MQAGAEFELCRLVAVVLPAGSYRVSDTEVGLLQQLVATATASPRYI